MRPGEGDLAPGSASTFLVGSEHVDYRPVNIDAHEVQRRSDDFHIFIGKLGRVPAGILQVEVGVLSFEHDGQEGAVAFPRRRSGGVDVFGGLD